MKVLCCEIWNAKYFEISKIQMLIFYYTNSIQVNENQEWTLKVKSGVWMPDN